jgi:hypothetical protein
MAVPTRETPRQLKEVVEENFTARAVEAACVRNGLH